MRRQLTTLQAELQEAIRNEASARADHVKQSELAHEEHDKYERELMFHAKTMEELTAIKEKMGSFQVSAHENILLSTCTYCTVLIIDNFPIFV